MIDELRNALTAQARSGLAVTYGQLARSLALAPPQTIHRLALALEQLMEEDAAAGRPLLAALVTSKARRGRPAPGFFAKARALGVFSGDPDGPAEEAFHTAEANRALAYYRVQPISGESPCAKT